MIFAWLYILILLQFCLQVNTIIEIIVTTTIEMIIMMDIIEMMIGSVDSVRCPRHIVIVIIVITIVIIIIIIIEMMVGSVDSVAALGI